MRLDKYLADAGIACRSDAKALIRAGKVSVNGTETTNPGMHIIIDRDRVICDGKQVNYQKYRYFLLYKPKGCVSAVKDNVHPTVMDYLSGENIKGAFPVGRLDLDTEGLLLITNDGDLAHRLLSPARYIEKTYFAILDKECPTTATEQFRNGIDIGDDKLTLPAKLVICQNGNQVYLTICEGRFHQVKRMFKKVGCNVTYLRRDTMAGLTLEGLRPGEYRLLSEGEVKELYKL